MNRLVCTNLDGVSSGDLPPTSRAPGAPARVLFLHGMEVGFATTAGNLEHYAAGRADIDAVHVRLSPPGWLRLACRQFPVPVGELDYRYLRHMLFWRMHLRTLLGPGRMFPLDPFDVVHITTQQRAMVIRDFERPDRNPTGTKFVVNLDATLRGWEAMRGLVRLAPPIDWSMEGRILRSADMLACATEWVAGSAAGEYGVEPTRIVIHKPCARISLGNVENAPRKLFNILFVGGVWKDKGGARLLRWHQERWADRAVLHIVSGSAPQEATRNVVFHGRVEHEKLLGKLLPAADIFVVPTKWDTFMIAAQEAQAAGVPVVTTRTGGVPECVADGVTGFLCDRHEDAAYIRAVERLMDDASLRERMARAGRERARVDLSPDTWHNHLLDQIVALADRRPIRRWPAAIPEPAGSAATRSPSPTA